MEPMVMALANVFRVGEANTAVPQALYEETGFLLQILNDVQVLAVDPAGENQEQQLQSRRERRNGR
jgi:hypothetical protein